ncbi:MAG: hypothetical protein WCP22_07900 [Chlamydiota bacterium]
MERHELKKVTRFEGPNGEETSAERATMVITRTYSPDGLEISCFMQTAESWREEKEAERNGHW